MNAIGIRSYGLAIGLRAEDPELLAVLMGELPSGWRTTPASRFHRRYEVCSTGRAAYRLTIDEQPSTDVGDLPALREQFEGDMRLFVAEHARRRIFVHAGVVSYGGQAIVLPGRSYAGKSTLVAELVRAGAAYYSDEYAVLDIDGMVHPFHRPITLRLRGGGDARVEISSLGGALGHCRLPVGAVIFTRYRDGNDWSPIPIGPSEAALRLLNNTVAARSRSEEACTVICRAVGGAQRLLGARGEAAATAAAILSALV